MLIARHTAGRSLLVFVAGAQVVLLTGKFDHGLAYIAFVFRRIARWPERALLRTGCAEDKKGCEFWSAVQHGLSEIAGERSIPMLAL